MFEELDEAIVDDPSWAIPGSLCLWNRNVLGLPLSIPVGELRLPVPWLLKIKTRFMSIFFVKAKTPEYASHAKLK